MEARGARTKVRYHTIELVVGKTNSLEGDWRIRKEWKGSGDDRLRLLAMGTMGSGKDFFQEVRKQVTAMAEKEKAGG